MEMQLINPLVAQLTHRAFPEVADALRAVADQITHAWDIAVRKAMPQMRYLSFDQLKDSTPEILIAIADAMGSADPTLIEALVRRAPLQGLSRLELKFDVLEIMQEDRLLRAIHRRRDRRCCTGCDPESNVSCPVRGSRSSEVHGRTR